MTVVLLGCGVLACIGLYSIGMITSGATASQSFGLGDAVAIVYVEGPIVMGEAPSGFSDNAAYAETIVEYLRAAQDNSSVKAIVLRIESPGGSVVASREIYDAILAARKKGKPVVASMGEVAASGGYYIAAGAHKIYAEPATLTGSIGVISVFPNMEGLTEKIGVKMIVVKSGPHKDESYGFRDLTPEERAAWQQLIDEVYDDFVGVVVEGRHLDIAKVKTLADGSVYTGKQAKANGLVDEIGDLDAAVKVAAQMGKIPGEPRTIKYRREPGFFTSLFGSLAPTFATRDLVELFALRQWGRVMYLYVAP